MDDNNELIIYVLRQLRYGVPEQTIRDTLVQNGWPLPLIDRAFSLVQQSAPHSVPPSSYDPQSQPASQEMSLPAAQSADQGAEQQVALRPVMPTRESQPKEPTKTGKRFLVIALVCILLAGIGAGAYFAYQAYSSDTSTGKPKQPTTTQISRDKDDARKKNIRQVAGKLTEYYNAKQTYPTLAQLNDGGFASSTKGFDISKYKDPAWDATRSDCVNEQGNVIFAEARSEGCYSYRATASNGAECGAEGTPCTRAVLTANLEKNKPYIVALDRNRQE
ncbi:MAG TPA: hypothetical protein VFT16_05385 [Candidatus Saccharimonadales bacterium]|nr:hypothetical protein [Candidatus Saccharimonadales bacterium]